MFRNIIVLYFLWEKSRKIRKWKIWEITMDDLYQEKLLSAMIIMALLLLLLVTLGV